MRAMTTLRAIVVTAGALSVPPFAPDEDRLFPVVRDGKWGYVDHAGKLAIELQFQGAKPFSDGLAAVKQDGQWGYINPAGELAIKPQFDGADELCPASPGTGVFHRLG